MGHEELRQLPSVDEILRSDEVAPLLARFPRRVLTEAVRAALDARRQRLRAGDGPANGQGGELPARPPAREIEQRIARARQPTLRRAINATGVVLHTNLGRAPLPASALAAVAEVAAGYSTLEYAPGRRERGSRQDHVAQALCALTGAEAALVVNNNAGAVLVALAALAADREVIVSRGELIEIGGGFRIPDVMRASGARLREVGTTNKTRAADYAGAVGPDSALILKVHRSNFAMVGFTEEVELDALAALGQQHGLPVMIDLGSGAFVDTRALGLPAEPTVRAALELGAGLVAFSGDKLLGGPQAGILVGRRALVERIAVHPLLRALRPDKLTLAALGATLAIYRDGTELRDVPALRMLATPLDVIERRMKAILDGLAGLAGVAAQGCRLRSRVGGGALPLGELDTWAVRVRAAALDADALAHGLADGEPCIVARVQDDAVVIDPRTLADDEVGEVVAALARIAGAQVANPPPPA
ncbi:MAG TPA: L-seryl-tRNA(Sec) selenium transferase [Polyangia bacterium]|nr:L-seryl-tRNA(Sec) selenium transferase [Polyangia bacterium]